MSEVWNDTTCRKGKYTPALHLTAPRNLSKLRRPDGGSDDTEHKGGYRLKHNLVPCVKGTIQVKHWVTYILRQRPLWSAKCFQIG